MTRPNFVFILIDDMGWRDIECYGSPFYETPVLNTLAQQGMRFTDAYASCPVCSPTRASVMTGRYPARVGITNFIKGVEKGRLLCPPYLDHLPLSEKTIARALKDAGYRTYCVGKWHLGGEEFHPDKHGFDVNIGGCHIGHPHKGYFSPWHIPTLPDGPPGEYLTDRLASEAVKLIENNGPDPFFLYLPFYAVHTPIQAPKELIGKYERKAHALGLDTAQALEDGEPFPCEHKKHLRVRRRRIQSDPVYAAMVENLDTNIGRVLDALERAGKAGNTVVFFTSDNGGLSTAEGSPTTNAPLSEGKGWMYDGGVREPLIVRWPGVTAPGSVCTTPVTTPDFYPTMLEMAGLPLMPDQHADGVSLCPLLRGAQSLEREAIFWHYPHYGNQGGTPGCSVRCGDYKLIEFFEDGRLELYNLREDIGEERNLAGSLPGVTKKLHAMLVKWREEIHALIPERNPEYELPR